MCLPYLIDDPLLVGSLLLVGFVVDLSFYLLQQFLVFSQCILDLDQLLVVGLDACPTFDDGELVLLVF